MRKQLEAAARRTIERGEVWFPIASNGALEEGLQVERVLLGLHEGQHIYIVDAQDTLDFFAGLDNFKLEQARRRLSQQWAKTKKGDGSK
jgi:hypothetical protein